MTVFADIVREQHLADNPPEPKTRPETEEIVTPSGLGIRYEDGKHLYFLREEGDPPTDWRRVPSVSTILKCLDKPALPWWGMTVGVSGVLRLQQDGKLPPVCDPATVVSLLTEHKLTVNHVRNKAAARGVTVHDALEAWCRDGEVPNPDLWPEDQQGYVHGLLAFLEAVDLTPEASECMVASQTHGYAGRYDLRCRLDEATVRCLAHKDPAKDAWALIESGRYMLDLKTSSGVYLEHHLQLEGYEGASVECGYGPTDHRAVLRVTADGRYELRLSRARHQDFLAVLGCHLALEQLKSREKAA